jgi:CO dehydrogenase/acetyl-CoA synthase gamma subunit (corrinoid Fe-S protein)
MALKADLYLDRIDPQRYFTPAECRSCGYPSCREWLEKLKAGTVRPTDCATLSPTRAYALELVLSMSRILPSAEITQHPVPGLLGWQPINDPGPDAPVLVTGNALVTQEVFMAVLSTTIAPFHLLFIDARGHTVDMAVIYRTFTLEALRKGLESACLSDILSHRRLILPGPAAAIADDLQTIKGWSIAFGPYCVGELPLFLGDYWQRPGISET